MLNNPFLSPEQNRAVVDNTSEAIQSGFARLYAQYIIKKAQFCDLEAKQALLAGNTGKANELEVECRDLFKIATDEYPFFIFSLQPQNESSRYAVYRIPETNMRAIKGSLVTLDDDFIRIASYPAEQVNSTLDQTIEFARDCIARQVCARMLC